MSKIPYPHLVKEVADAYRAVSGTVDAVKYGELPGKIEELHIGETAESEVYLLAADANAILNLNPSAAVKFDISNSHPSLTGAVDGSVCVGDTVGLSTDEFDLTQTTKQWQRSTGNTIKESMLSSSAGETICVLYGRRYVKTRDGDAIIGYMHNSGGYSGPLIVSSVSADAVIFDGGGGEMTAGGTVVFKGTTYWYNSGGYWMGGDPPDTSGLNRYKVPQTTTIQEGVLLLLNVAFEYLWANIDGATGDTYTVTSDDTVIRCELNGSGDYTGTAISEQATTE